MDDLECFIKDNLRIILSIILVTVIALGIYSYANNTNSGLDDINMDRTIRFNEKTCVCTCGDTEELNTK